MSTVAELKTIIASKLTKRVIDDFIESCIVIGVTLIIIFFYPIISWSISEGWTLSRCYYAPPVGQGRPLGAHRPPEMTKIAQISEIPTPTQFFDDYVLESRPVILKNVARNFRAFNIWTDSYLQETAGSLNVKWRNVDGHQNMTSLQKFLETYPGKKAYLYSEVPYVLRNDISPRLPLTCGNFQTAFKETAFWMNGGNMTLGLNTEIVDTFHCIMKGAQSVFLVDRLHHNIAQQGVRAGLELANIDLCWDRNLVYLPWYDVALDEGDCLFIPSKWYKQITFQNSRNLGVTFRYLRLLHFNHTDCEVNGEESARQTAVASEQEHLKFEIIALAENHATLDLYNFQKIFQMNGTNNPESLRKLFSLLDQDSDSELIPEELYSLETTDFLRFFPGYKTRDSGGPWPAAEKPEPEPFKKEL